MRQVKKGALSLIVGTCILILSGLLFYSTAFAKEIEEEREYKPVDLVLVIDGSGSMGYSDPNRTAISAGRMLTNMMPASDSRIAIISFNTKPTIHTGDGSGTGALVSLDAFANVETVRDALSEVRYSGDTGIGNALLAATELLQQQSDDSHQGAIILFTDGTDDFGRDAIGLARCGENEALALKQAKKLGYPVYCVGYDYRLPDGGTSMGANGEGLAKLRNIADATGGRFQAITEINEMEQLLVDFLADVCDLIYKPIVTIPGDGELHEAEIPVSPTVVELDIRIAGGGEDAISKGEVHLYDPEGNELGLTNSGNVRFDVDATAASIKVIMPQSGNWRLSISGVHGDDIHVGMLEHFKMNLKSRLVFPDQNPEGVVYAHDKVRVEAWLTYDGEDIDDPALYDAVTSATATFVSRADEADTTVVDLKRKGSLFRGSFTVPADSFYDITIRINWDTVYREDRLTVMSSNKPLELVGEIEDVTLNKNKSVTIDNIYQYVRDEENDTITAEVKSVGTPDVADVVVNGDSIIVTGRKWSSTLVTIVFRDSQGNTVESTFKAKVNDPVALALIIAGFIGIILLVLTAIYFIYRKTFRIFGHIRVGIIKELTYGDEEQPVAEEVIFEDYHRMNREQVVEYGQNAVQEDGDGVWGNHQNGDNDRDNNGGWGDSQDVDDNVYSDGGAQGGWGDRQDGDAHNDGGAQGGWGDGQDVDDNVYSGGGAQGGWGDRRDGDAHNDGGAQGGWGDWDEDQGDGGRNPNVNAAVPQNPDPELIEDDRRDAAFEGGRLDIASSITKKDSSLFSVLKTFVDAYSRHMTIGNHVSPRATRVSNCVLTQLKDFSQFKIVGTRFGRGGIRIRIPKRTTIVVERPKPIKNQLVLKRSAVMAFTIRATGAPTGIYLEIEYEPLS